jgi:hypothetical protein
MGGISLLLTTGPSLNSGIWDIGRLLLCAAIIDLGQHGFAPAGLGAGPRADSGAAKKHLLPISMAEAALLI